MRTSASVLTCVLVLQGICYAQESSSARSAPLARSVAAAIDDAPAAEQRQGDLLPNGNRRRYGADAASRRRTGLIMMGAGFATAAAGAFVLKQDGNAEAGKTLIVVGAAAGGLGFWLFDHAKDISPRRIQPANAPEFGVRYHVAW